MKKTNLLFVISSFSLVLFCSPAFAEQCTDGVHALLSWTNVIKGNANQWVDRAKSLGFKVNHSPKDNTVLVFPPNYGHGINSTYGHVAVLRDTDKKKGFLIQDSNGIAGGDRKTKWIQSIDFGKVHIIHR